MKTVRQRYLDSKNGDLTRYAGMIGEEFRSQIDRLSQIIGAAHEPSIGAYKEGLLRSCIKHYLPKRYSAGTGFVVFTRKSPRAEAAGENVDILNLREHEVSSQLDIIVFDDLNYATIFRDDDFAVVRPEAVKAIIEVKGFLRRNDIGGIVDKYIKLDQQFVDYGNYRRQYEEIEVMRFPGLLLMAWNVYVDRHGHPQCDGKILRKALVGAYRKKLSSDRLNPNVFPL